MAPKGKALAVLLLQVIGCITTPAPQATALAPPVEFTVNPNVGPGGSVYKDSSHFRVYGVDGKEADGVLNMMEAAYYCFVDTLGWRSSGLSFNLDNDADGPWYKENVYAIGSVGGAGGVFKSDYRTGLSWVEVLRFLVADSRTTVHEYGHALTYHAKTWVDQTATGAWWEPLANWVADTYATAPVCEEGRKKYNRPVGETLMELEKVIGDAHQVIVDGSQGSGNYYQAWPIFTYLTSNPDGHPGLGQDTVNQLFLQYEEGSNETPLHTLERVSTEVSVQQLVGRYWARMAYLDIGHTVAQEAFFSQRRRLNFDNVDWQGSSFTPKSGREPLYMGANIVPLQTSGVGTVSVNVSSGGEYTGTLVVFDTNSNTGRYVDVVDGSASADVAEGEEVSFVISNTPASLIQYDPFNLSGEVTVGLGYSVEVTGATA